MSETSEFPPTVVYTGIFDNYDVLHEPRDPNPDLDYICFTDDKTLTSDTWTIYQYTPEKLPPNLANRKLKLLPHRFDVFDDYDYSVYLDGNIQLLNDITDLVARYQDHAFAAPQHYQRNCVYDEATACIETGKGDPDAIRKQIDRYHTEGFPENHGLSANSVLYRQHHRPDVKELMEAWWQELKTESNRDQLSLPYVSWKTGIEYTRVNDGPRLNSDYFRLHPHLPDRPWKHLGRSWIRISATRDQDPVRKALYMAGKAIQKARRDGLWELGRAVKRRMWTQTLRPPVLAVADRYGIVGPDDIYEADYYAKRRQDPYRSESHKIAEVFRAEFEPESVIDFGCAIGAYLEPYYDAGITVQGVEGNQSALDHAVIPPDLIDHHDLREPYATSRDFDLVLSIEVAEHLPKSAADVFVDTLTQAGSLVVMTAAPPGQGGTHHVNEQPRDYWKRKFAKRGFKYDADAVTRVRDAITVETFAHVPQNLFVFKRK